MSLWVGSMTETLDDRGDIQDSPEYLEIQRALQSALDHFNRIESMAELDYNQQQFRGSVVKLQELMADVVRQLSTAREQSTMSLE